MSYVLYLGKKKFNSNVIGVVNHLYVPFPSHPHVIKIKILTANVFQL